LRNIISDAVRDEDGRLIQPLVIRCRCGQPLEVPHFTNTCRCGADYNWAGQELAPRYQWGEETGEHWSDCY
jgi:hypothetical protein